MNLFLRMTARSIARTRVAAAVCQRNFPASSASAFRLARFQRSHLYAARSYGAEDVKNAKDAECFLPYHLEDELRISDSVKIKVDHWNRNQDGRNYEILISIKVRQEGGREALMAALRDAYYNLLPAQLVNDKGEVLATKEQIKAFHVDWGFADSSITVFCAY
jgi:hypothetical protein